MPPPSSSSSSSSSASSPGILNLEGLTVQQLAARFKISKDYAELLTKYVSLPPIAQLSVEPGAIGLTAASLNTASTTRQRWIAVTDEVARAAPHIASSSSYLLPDLLALPHYQQAVKGRPQSMRVEFQAAPPSDEMIAQQQKHEAVKQSQGPQGPTGPVSGSDPRA